MNAVTANTKSTLLLNNAWQPITTVTARAAFGHLLRGRISAIDMNGNIFHSLETWNVLGEFYDDQPMMRSVNASWPIPTIVVVTSKFFRKPKKKKLSLFETAKLYDFTCQYCLQKFGMKDLTIDHILPKSKKGADTHENKICCCVFCNREKGAKHPWHDINGNIPSPLGIPAIIIHAPTIRPEWEYFLKI